MRGVGDELALGGPAASTAHQTAYQRELAYAECMRAHGLPSAALTAQADAQGAFNTLFLGLGAVALLIGAAAGLLPALRAARLSPTQALWTL